MLAFRIGLTLGFGLITAIGVQNIFIIKQGIKNEFALVCALVCIICDIFLIGLSVLGINQLINEVAWIKQGLMILGVGFLLTYGALSLYRGCRIQAIQRTLSSLDDASAVPMGKIILLALSFSLLNPHAILDTVVLMGGFASQYEGWEQYQFMFGTFAASIIWFLSLVTVSRFAAKFLMSPRGWQLLELGSGIIMLILAGKLLREWI